MSPKQFLPVLLALMVAIRLSPRASALPWRRGTPSLTASADDCVDRAIAGALQGCGCGGVTGEERGQAVAQVVGCLCGYFGHHCQSANIGMAHLVALSGWDALCAHRMMRTSLASSSATLRDHATRQKKLVRATRSALVASTRLHASQTRQNAASMRLLDADASLLLLLKKMEAPARALPGMVNQMRWASAEAKRLDAYWRAAAERHRRLESRLRGAATDARESDKAAVAALGLHFAVVLVAGACTRGRQRVRQLGLVVADAMLVMDGKRSDGWWFRFAALLVLVLGAVGNTRAGGRRVGARKRREGRGGRQKVFLARTLRGRAERGR